MGGNIMKSSSHSQGIVLWLGLLFSLLGNPWRNGCFLNKAMNGCPSLAVVYYCDQPVATLKNLYKVFPGYARRRIS
jgi:hypothetical protein